jgi:hypothetical protein
MIICPKKCFIFGIIQFKECFQFVDLLLSVVSGTRHLEACCMLFVAFLPSCNQVWVMVMKYISHSTKKRMNLNTAIPSRDRASSTIPWSALVATADSTPVRGELGGSLTLLILLGQMETKLVFSWIWMEEIYYFSLVDETYHLGFHLA